MKTIIESTAYGTCSAFFGYVLTGYSSIQKIHRIALGVGLGMIVGIAKCIHLVRLQRQNKETPQHQFAKKTIATYRHNVLKTLIQSHNGTAEKLLSKLQKIPQRQYERILENKTKRSLPDPLQRDELILGCLMQLKDNDLPLLYVPIVKRLIKKLEMWKTIHLCLFYIDEKRSIFL